MYPLTWNKIGNYIYTHFLEAIGKRKSDHSGANDYDRRDHGKYRKSTEDLTIQATWLCRVDQVLF